MCSDRKNESTLFGSVENWIEFRSNRTWDSFTSNSDETHFALIFEIESSFEIKVNEMNKSLISTIVMFIYEYIRL